MKSFLLTAVILSANVAFAAINTVQAFDMEMSLSIDGKAVTSPRIIAKEGEKETYLHEADGQKSLIEVVAKDAKTKDGTAAIEMEFTISQIAEDGTAKIISQPRILALPNSEAEITVGGNGRPNVLALKVIANKLSF